MLSLWLNLLIFVKTTQRVLLPLRKLRFDHFLHYLAHQSPLDVRYEEQINLYIVGGNNVRWDHIFFCSFICPYNFTYQFAPSLNASLNW